MDQRANTSTAKRRGGNRKLWTTIGAAGGAAAYLAGTKQGRSVACWIGRTVSKPFRSGNEQQNQFENDFEPRMQNQTRTRG